MEEEAMGPKTRCRSRRKNKKLKCDGKLWQARHRKRGGNNRSNKLKVATDRPRGRRMVEVPPPTPPAF